MRSAYKCLGTCPQLKVDKKKRYTFNSLIKSSSQHYLVFNELSEFLLSQTTLHWLHSMLT